MKFFNKIASSLMIAAALTTSCSQDVMDSEAVVNSEDRVVTFTINEPVATRGSILTNDTFESLTIYVVNSERTYTSSVKMAKDENGIWGQSSMISLPSSGTTTFYALSDQRAGEEASGITFVNDENGPYVSYSMPTDVASQPTLVMATPVELEGDALSLNVELDFYYALSIVGFTSSGDYTIKSLSINNFKNGADIAFGDEYTSDSFSNYTEATSALSIDLLDSTDYSDINYLMIPVQTLAGAELKIGMSYGDGDVEYSTVTLPGSEDLLTCGYLKYINLDTGTYVDTSDVTIKAESYDISMLVDGTYDTDVTTDRDTTITWESNDESIATVDSYGVITGVKGGKTTITATPLYGDAVTFSVTVYNTISTLVLTPSTQKIVLNSYTTVEAVVGVAGDYLEGYTLSVAGVSDTYNTENGSGWCIALPSSTSTSTGKIYNLRAENVGTRVMKVSVKGSMSGTIISETFEVVVYAENVDVTVDVTGPGNPEIVDDVVLGAE